MQRNSKPLIWRPAGASDTEDASTTFNGAMAALQNLIPDPKTVKLWQCRPAAVQLIDFSGNAFSSGFSSGFGGPFQGAYAVTCLTILGNLAYGLVSQTALPGKDYPFCFNLTTGALVTVTGVTAANVPNSQPVVGEWTPPTMALIGTQLMVTHPGFTGGVNGYVGFFDLSLPGAPIWGSGQLTGPIQFTVAPTGVAQFNNRAYYLHNDPQQPAVIFSDPLDPLAVATGTQVLTLGDNIPLTAIAGLPLNNQLGGIVQSVIVFKGLSDIYQIKGDPVTNDLRRDALNVATGTLAPNTICSTPKGLAFISPDGLRVIDYNAHVSDPIGMDGAGISVPFRYALNQSRMAAACSGTVLRVNVQNSLLANSPWQEYWFDISRGIWSGPHTFASTVLEPWEDTFICCPAAKPFGLWRSDTAQNPSSVFIEDGAPMSFLWSTPLLPNTDQMTQNAMTETLMNMAFTGPAFSSGFSSGFSSPFGPTPLPFTIMANDQDLNILGSVTVGPGSLGLHSAMVARQVPWAEPLVFVRMQLHVIGVSNAGVKLGALEMRYQILRAFADLLNVA